MLTAFVVSGLALTGVVGFIVIVLPRIGSAFEKYDEWNDRNGDMS